MESNERDLFSFHFYSSTCDALWKKNLKPRMTTNRDGEEEGGWKRGEEGRFVTEKHGNKTETKQAKKGKEHG